MKLAYGRYMKHLTDTAIGLQGPAGQLGRDDSADAGAWHRRFLHAPSLRIAGGSDQVQATIVGERTLGLPPEPRPDRTLPFRPAAGTQRPNGQHPHQ
jgi:acyl-CoA dehydrogenase